MGVLAGKFTAAASCAAGLALAACYAPSVHDCTVSCGSASDCIAGQICGPDGLCAAPEVAGRCPKLAPDARASDDQPGDAAAPHDAGLDAAPDAAAGVPLRVQITGKGSVVIDDAATCSAQDPQHGTCGYDIAAGVPHTVQAVELTTDEVFLMWTSLVCAGQGRRCALTAIAATTVSARFGKSGMHRAP